MKQHTAGKKQLSVQGKDDCLICGIVFCLFIVIEVTFISFRCTTWWFDNCIHWEMITTVVYLPFITLPIIFFYTSSKADLCFVILIGAEEMKKIISFLKNVWLQGKSFAAYLSPLKINLKNLSFITALWLLAFSSTKMQVHKEKIIAFLVYCGIPCIYNSFWNL